MALVVAMGPTGLSNIDMNRSARETLPNYRSLSYYEIWLAALEKLVAQKGSGGDALPPAKRVLEAGMVAAAITTNNPFSRSPTQPARFMVGDRVHTCADEKSHHTRLPGYARGKNGVVQRVHGVHVFPDTKPTAWASPRNGFTTWLSRLPNCGAKSSPRNPSFRWMRGNRTWNLHDRSLLA